MTQPRILDFAFDLSGEAAGVLTRQTPAGLQLWCAVRRRWLVYQPEELVRQALLAYLVKAGFSLGRIQIETRVGTGATRSDLVVHDRALRPWLLAEVKAPRVDHRSGIAQLADYARHLDVSYCLSTNGSWASCFVRDHETESWRPLADWPFGHTGEQDG